MSGPSEPAAASGSVPQARPRPTDMSEQQLGFTPRDAVRWLDPPTLIKTGWLSLVSGIFASFADKREIQGSLDARIFRHCDGRHGPDPDRDRQLEDPHLDNDCDQQELWLDFVADLGDSFNATYSVAHQLSQPALELPALRAGPGPSEGTLRLPRGELLVMGGDQVYPAASTREYEDRTKGVYRAALPVLGEDSPTLYALPGNHDWYDGLTSFLRVFAQGRPFGGWNTRQTRSYFAVQLPHRWWLLAVDTQFDDYIDAPQLRYFQDVKARMRAGDKIILCTPKPSWVSAGSGGALRGWDTIEFFRREMVHPEARIMLMLSGDAHHYAHYQRVPPADPAPEEPKWTGPEQLITCGLGGAYLAATHHLPNKLTFPPKGFRLSPRTEAGATSAEFVRKKRYPDNATSRGLSTGVFRLPWRNPAFLLVTATTQLAMTLALLHLFTAPGKPAYWVPAILVGVGLGLAAVAFARTHEPRLTWKHRLAGGVHAIIHIGLSLGWAVLLRLLDDALPSAWALIPIAVLGFAVLAVLDAELVALYLLVVSETGLNINELFAAQAIEDHKGFLRLHLDELGNLTVYPIKLARVCRSWVADPSAAESEPWLRPAGDPLNPELIEPPISISAPAPRVESRGNTANP